MQKNKDQAETEASSLQEQLTQTLDKIDTLEADLDKKQEEVEKAGDDLEEAAAKQTEQYESMKLRIKYMYEEGNSSLLETLFSSTSFTDLLNKAERDKIAEAGDYLEAIYEGITDSGVGGKNNTIKEKIYGIACSKLCYFSNDY